jgi:hypothetical protein
VACVGVLAINADSDCQDLLARPIADWLARPNTDWLARPIADWFARPIADWFARPIADWFAHPIDKWFARPIAEWFAVLIVATSHAPGRDLAQTIGRVYESETYKSTCPISSFLSCTTTPQNACLSSARLDSGVRPCATFST